MSCKSFRADMRAFCHASNENEIFTTPSVARLKTRCHVKETKSQGPVPTHVGSRPTVSGVMRPRTRNTYVPATLRQDEFLQIESGLKQRRDIAIKRV